MNDTPVLDIVIVSWNTIEMTTNCLRTLAAELTSSGIYAKVWIVDNNSTDGSPDAIRANFPEFTLIQNKDNIGFARANNQAIALGTAPYVLLLNSDTLVPPASIARLLDYMCQHSDIGAIGPKLVYENGAVQTSVDTVTTPASQIFYCLSFHFPPFDRFLRRAFRWRRYRRVAGVHPRAVELLSAACLLVRREVFDRVGLLPEQYFLFSEENDFFWRLKQRRIRSVYYPEVQITHLLGGSRKSEATSMADRHFFVSRIRFLKHRYPSQILFTRLIHAFFLNWSLCYALLSDYFRKRKSGYPQQYQDLRTLLKAELSSKEYQSTISPD